MLKIIVQRRGQKTIHITEDGVMGRSTILLLYQELLGRIDAGESSPILYFEPDGTPRRIAPKDLEDVSLVEL